MTGRLPFISDPLTRTLDLITRAARAGQCLTYDQLNARLGGGNVVEKYARELADQKLVVIDRSCRPYLLKPAPVAVVAR
jgi:hypothetical protein